MTQPVSLDPAAFAHGALRRLAELKGGKSGSIFTSDLSVSEFLLVREVGFRPLGLVVGSSVYHIGLQVQSWKENQELDSLSHALSDARQRAATRMETQAGGLGADGVIGVRLRIQSHEFGSDIAEFVAVGTAVKAEPGGGGGRTGDGRPGGGRNWRNNKGQPFTSDLSGQDFCALIRAGYAPLAMVVGACVYHIAPQRLRQVIANVGRNTELEPFTRALYAARDLAMSRMRTAARALQAEGIVGLQLQQHSHAWDAHTTEFLAVGTAVRPLRDTHKIEPP